MTTPAHGTPVAPHAATPSKGTALHPVSGTIGGGATPSTGTPAALPPTPTPPKGTAVVAPPSHGPTAPPVPLPGLPPPPATPAKRPMIPQPPVLPTTPPPPIAWFKQPTPPMGQPAVAVPPAGGDKIENKIPWIFPFVTSVIFVGFIAFMMTMTRCDLDSIKDNQSEMKTDLAKIKGAVIATDSKGEQITVLSALTGINGKIDGLAKKSDVEGLAKTSDIDDLSSKLDGLAKKSDLRGLARTSDLDGLSANTDPSGLATTTDINNLNAKIDGLSGIALETNKIVKERANAKPRVVVVRAVQPKAKKVANKK